MYACIVINIASVIQILECFIMLFDQMKHKIKLQLILQEVKRKMSGDHAAVALWRYGLLSTRGIKALPPVFRQSSLRRTHFTVTVSSPHFYCTLGSDIYM